VESSFNKSNRNLDRDSDRRDYVSQMSGTTNHFNYLVYIYIYIYIYVCMCVGVISIYKIYIN